MDIPTLDTAPTSRSSAATATAWSSTCSAITATRSAIVAAGTSQIQRNIVAGLMGLKV